MKYGWLFIAVLVAGCDVIPPAQSDPTRFYVLSSAATGGGGNENGSAALAHWRIGLKAVDVSGYLRRPEMIVRNGQNEIQIEEYARWGENLQTGITRLLQRQLAAAPSVARVDVQPFALDRNRDFDVAVTVVHCEGATGSGGTTARFEAEIELTTGSEPPRIVARKTFAAPAAGWDDRDFGALAGLLSTDVQALGEQILSLLPADK